MIGKRAPGIRTAFGTKPRKKRPAEESLQETLNRSAFTRTEDNEESDTEATGDNQADETGTDTRSFMSVVWDQSNRLGLAHYSCQTRELMCSSLYATAPEVPWLLRVVREQVQVPAAAIINSAVPAEARAELTQAASAGAQDQSPPAPQQEDILQSNSAPWGVQSKQMHTQPLVRVLKGSAFLLDHCHAVLNRLIVGRRGLAATAPGSACIDTSDGNLVRACGALLDWLDNAGLLEVAFHQTSAPISAAAPTGFGAGATDASFAFGGGLDSTVGSEAQAPGNPPVQKRYWVQAVRLMPLTDFMQMDALAFRALGIFPPPRNPETGASGADLCLVSHLDHTVSASGRRELRAWCARPSLDAAPPARSTADVIRHRHDAVEFFLAAQTQLPELWRELRGYMKKTRDVSRLLLRIARIAATPADWFGLQKTMLYSSMIKDTLGVLLGNVNPPSTRSGQVRPSTAAPYSAATPFIIKAVIDEFAPDLMFLHNAIDSIVDWQVSREDGVLSVRAGVDDVLDEKRRIYADLPDFLGDLSLRELQEHRHLHSLTIKYFPQIGFVVELRKTENGLGNLSASGQRQLSGNGQVDSSIMTAQIMEMVPADFSFRFESADSLYFKSPVTTELDEAFGDITGVIRDLEGSIVRQLEQRVVEHESLLFCVGARLAELDVLASFAEAAKQSQYIRPIITPEPVLVVKAARHPLLQEVLPHTLVPNDISLVPSIASPQPDVHSEDKNNEGPGSVAIVTGPNSSGKSVYLKTIGLITFMAQIGCFVPAQAAVIGITDRIFTRIQSLEAATAEQSTFTSDLHQVGLMLRHATPHSLLLLDEFGKGTSSLDGVAILASTIRAILRIGSSDTPTTHERPAVLLAPRSAITTHFTEALDSGILLDPAVDETSIHGHPKGVAYYHMQVMLHKPGDDRTDRSTISSPPSSGYEDSVVPLFKLVPGCASSSYGFACALQAGIPRVLIDRAADITRLVKSRQCILPTPAYLLDIKENKRMQDQISAAQRLLAITDWQKARETPVGAGSSVRELLSLLRDCMLV